MAETRLSVFSAILSLYSEGDKNLWQKFLFINCQIFFLSILPSRNRSRSTDFSWRNFRYRRGRRTFSKNDGFWVDQNDEVVNFKSRVTMVEEVEERVKSEGKGEIAPLRSPVKTKKSWKKKTKLHLKM